MPRFLRANAKTINVNAAPRREFAWHHVAPEGELAVDVAKVGNELVIVAPIAGADPETLSVSIDHDMVTIRGSRQQQSEAKSHEYFYQECFWGAFSRSIILPVEVSKDKSKATIKNGILTIRIPVVRASAEIPIEIIDEA